MTETRDSVSLQWLTPSQLEVEALAQREFNPRNTERIVKEFDPEKVRVLTVSHRDGRYFVTDGQHRRAALIEKGLGDVPVPCNVWEDLTVADDAKGFVASNVETVSVNPVDTFRIKVVAGDPAAVEIKDVLDAHGLTVKFGNAANYVSAVSALNWVYARGGRKLLEQTLDLIEATWGRDRQSRDGHIIKAIAVILMKVGNELDLDSFAHKVSADSTPARIMGTARTHVMATRRALYAQAAEVMITLYNRQRSSRRVTLA